MLAQNCYGDGLSTDGHTAASADCVLGRPIGGCLYNALENVEIDRSLVFSGYLYTACTESSVLRQPYFTRMATSVPGPLVSANERACDQFEVRIRKALEHPKMM